MAQSIAEVRCPGCLNLMTIKLIETMPKNSVELTYRGEPCGYGTKRTIKANDR